MSCHGNTLLSLALCSGCIVNACVVQYVSPHLPLYHGQAWLHHPLLTHVTHLVTQLSISRAKLSALCTPRSVYPHRIQFFVVLSFFSISFLVSSCLLQFTPYLYQPRRPHSILNPRTTYLLRTASASNKRIETAKGESKRGRSNLSSLNTYSTYTKREREKRKEKKKEKKSRFCAYLAEFAKVDSRPAQGTVNACSC